MTAIQHIDIMTSAFSGFLKPKLQTDRRGATISCCFAHPWPLNNWCWYRPLYKFSWYWKIYIKLPLHYIFVVVRRFLHKQKKTCSKISVSNSPISTLFPKRLLFSWLYFFNKDIYIYINTSKNPIIWFVKSFIYSDEVGKLIHDFFR